MRASELWRTTSPDNVYHVKEQNGKLHINETVGDSVGAYAAIKTCEDINNIPDVGDPTFFVEWPSGVSRLILPDSWETNAPYVGRPYDPARWHCYTVIQDYYKNEHNIDLPEFTYDIKRVQDSWSTTAFNTNAELNANWDTVVNPRVGDVVMMAVGVEAFNNSNPNHCGVYMGNDTFLHHYIGRTSCIEPYSPRWKQWTVNYVRNLNV